MGNLSHFIVVWRYNMIATTMTYLYTSTKFHHWDVTETALYLPSRASPARWFRNH